MKVLSILLFTLVISSYFARAQNMYTTNDLASIKIAGTSTMHDWEMETRKVTGKAEFILDGNEVKGIKSLNITIPAESLKSGKGAMDKNAYKALKTDDHKEISFLLTDVSKIGRSGNKYILTCNGKLTIAGTTKVVQLTANCLSSGNGGIQCTGGKVIKMTEYEVEPPSFMFGSVKTGDQLEIQFDVLFTNHSTVNPLSKKFNLMTMKTTKMNRLSMSLALVLVVAAGSAWAQLPAIQYFRPYDQRGVNVFETPKDDTVVFEGLKVRIGASFKQQYQNLSHSTGAGEVLALEGTPNEFNQNKLIDIGGGFNLAMANLNLDFQLADGVRVNLVTYLSSRHHSETWVKSGYFQIDKVGFLNSEFLDNLWKNLTLKVGHMEINYGDAHFRRSDGGNGMYNPFVENYLLDAFSTEIGAELYWQKNGLLAMVGVTDGEIQGNVTRPDDRKPSVYGKVGIDRDINENVRIRLTGSFYDTRSSISNTLYSGDRTGSHYYMVTEPEYYLSNGVRTATSVSNRFTSGRINPGFRDEVRSFMINPFVQVYGFEFFGNYEEARGKSSNETTEREYKQVAVDGLYRFLEDRFYVGARYNGLTGEESFGDVKVNRVAFAGGWYLTRNVMFKVEYVKQKYEDYPSTDIRHNMEFDGFLIEGVIGL